MGCKSTKATVLPAAPSSPSSRSAENTLLAPRKDGFQKDAGLPEDVLEAVKPLEVSFEGRWSGGSIAGTRLTLTDGTVASVRFDKRIGTLKFCFGGNYIVGELKNDDTIQWSNGDEWKRHHVCTSFRKHEGFIEGPDLCVQTLTLDEAKSKASSMPNCVGFTCCRQQVRLQNGLNACDAPVRIHFKSKWNIGKTVGDWISFQKADVVCAVGDSVMAVFTPNNRLYAAVIASISPDSEITVDWADRGKTHRKLSPSQVFKEYANAESDPDSDGEQAVEAVPLCHSRKDESETHAEVEKGTGLPRNSGWTRFLEQEETNKGEQAVQEQDDTHVRSESRQSYSNDCKQVQQLVCALQSESCSSTAANDNRSAVLEVPEGNSIKAPPRRERGTCCC